MKDKLRALILQALQKAASAGALTSADFPSIVIETPANPEHGDFATTVAMGMAKAEKKPPRAIAEIIVKHLEDAEGLLEKTDIAGPGFLNFRLRAGAWHQVLRDIDREKGEFGKSQAGAGKKVQVEFVSANPTGPLHIGHGRGAATGDAVASLLSAAGFDVTREYYINDAGNQMNTLGLSILLRYREALGQGAEFPETCYQGSYIRDIAREAIAKHGDRFLHVSEEEGVTFFSRFGGDLILKGIDDDLQDFGVVFDNWYSEQTLFDRGMVARAAETMKEKGLAYEQDGALWFRTTDYGDDKDRVMVRSNGVTTYFASDIAYHMEKYERGFDRVVDVWGADHHGYVTRLKAAVQGAGRASDDLQIILVQLVALLRDGQPVAMSTRSGEFVTLKEVVDEVGRDAARYFFLMRRSDSQLDFDLELAKRQSTDNPVYYVQYAHARICSIFENAAEKGITVDGIDEALLARLTGPDELELVKLLASYPQILEGAALAYEPHRIAYYLQEVAGALHSFYNRNRVIGEEMEVSRARLLLLGSVRQVLANALALLGMSAPERM